jgi:hypothetical protein
MPILSPPPVKGLDLRAPYGPLRRFGGSAKASVQGDRAGGIPDFRPKAACQAGRYPTAVTPRRCRSLGPYPVAIEAPFRGFSNERRKS